MPAPTAKAVAAFIREHAPCTRTQISTALGLTEHGARYRLRLLEERGSISRIQDTMPAQYIIGTRAPAKPKAPLSKRVIRPAGTWMLDHPVPVRSVFELVR